MFMFNLYPYLSVRSKIQTGVILPLTKGHHHRKNKKQFAGQRVATVTDATIFGTVSLNRVDYSDPYL